MNRTAIAIHGGAGAASHFIKKYEQDYKNSLSTIVRAGRKMLEDGCTAIEAVAGTARLLEDNPLFNAGKGAALNARGQVSMDAAIMNGATLKAGAVAGQDQIKNPVALAQAVMEHTPHVLMNGDGLNILRKFKGWDIVSKSYFMTAHQIQEYLDLKKDSRANNDNSVPHLNARERHGTVGCVALDCYGDLAAATSTGGASYCIPGRISDSCIIGAGCYANNKTCAVSVTGDGEYLMTRLAAHTVSMAMELADMPLQQACEYAIAKYPSDDCDAGIISVNRNGDIGICYNSERMHRAWIGSDGQLNCHIY